MVESIPLAEAKARLSAVVRDVGSADVEYVITVRGVPAARIVPVDGARPRALAGFGALRTDRPPLTAEEAHAEWRRAAEARHENDA